MCGSTAESDAVGTGPIRVANALLEARRLRRPVDAAPLAQYGAWSGMER